MQIYANERVWKRRHLIIDIIDVHFFSPGKKRNSTHHEHLADAPVDGQRHLLRSRRFGQTLRPNASPDRVKPKRLSIELGESYRLMYLTWNSMENTSAVHWIVRQPSSAPACTSSIIYRLIYSCVCERVCEINFVTNEKPETVAYIGRQSDETRSAKFKIRRVQFPLNQLTATNSTAAVDGRSHQVDTPVHFDKNVNDKYQQGKNSKWKRMGEGHV